MLIEVPESKTTQDSSIIPLINVVFLILIFLILSGQITQGDLFKVDLPESISQSQPSDQVHTLVVNAKGVLALDHRVVDLNQLGEFAKLISPKDEGQAPILLIKADANLHVRHLQPILSALKENRLYRVSIATLEQASS